MLINMISRKPTTAVCLHKYTITFTVPRYSTSPAKYVANNTSASNVHATVTVQSTQHLKSCKFRLDVQKFSCFWLSGLDCYWLTHRHVTAEIEATVKGLLRDWNVRPYGTASWINVHGRICQQCEKNNTTQRKKLRDCGVLKTNEISRHKVKEDHAKSWVTEASSRKRAPLNPLTLELNIYSLAHHLRKMWIFYKPIRITLRNTRHFVEE